MELSRVHKNMSNTFSYVHFIILGLYFMMSQYYVTNHTVQFRGDYYYTHYGLYWFLQKYIAKNRIIHFQFSVT